MPSTIYPSSNPPEPARLSSAYIRATSPSLLLSSITTNETEPPRGRASRTRPSIKQIQSSSFPSLSHTSTIYSSKNGFIHSVLEAYNNHHNLVLRPDDIWLAILTQLSFHFNSSPQPSLQPNSPPPSPSPLPQCERLEAQPSLRVGSVRSRSEIDLPLPPHLQQFLPAFSTTTQTDQTVASIILLGTAQKYLTYSQGTRCGIPSVTLLGTFSDWRDVYSRCAQLLGSGSLGKQAKQWYDSGLGSCLGGFVTSFQDPGGQQAQSFWGRVVIDGTEMNGSGRERYSGWIVKGFCWWDEEGRRIKGREAGLARTDIPMGFVKLKVGNGMEMLGGSLCVRVRDGGDTVQPEVGWIVYDT
ncbi:hypothetical protein QBC42DRAFT_274002 [Cladorrhinum samala]|uniref:Uncharacterized protein n=1 Tax=Cladorrhinum samala TaxID=585594 RepID=A0AAV9HGN0_9PEZI|nr:hypothetical protein QBC42DRAFT_274002 [Cladorrhinum samala]